MDSQNPHLREYHSQPASHQDVQSDSPSSVRHAPAYSEPPVTLQTAHVVAGAPAGYADQRASSPVISPNISDDGDDGIDGDDGNDEDDGPVTVPVLGIQPFQGIQDHMPGDDSATQLGQRVSASGPDDHDGEGEKRRDGGYSGDEDDALNAFDVDIALGFGNEPILREDAFAFRERSLESWKRTRRTALTLLALAAMLAVAILGATLAASYMRPATRGLSLAPSQPTVSSYSGGLVIQGPETISPTPEAPKYQIGAWMSNNAPSGGSVKVFVRVTEDIKPLAHVAVTLTAQVPGGTLRYGPTKTDNYGLATFDVRYGGLSGSPVFVTATAKVDRQTTLTADTMFVPI